MWPTGKDGAVEQLSVSFDSTVVLLGSMQARFGSTSEPSVAVTKNVPMICTSTCSPAESGTGSPWTSSWWPGPCGKGGENGVLPGPAPRVGDVLTPIGMSSTGKGSWTWTFCARQGWSAEFSSHFNAAVIV